MRFVRCFLVSNKQSKSVAGLINYGSIASVLNFVNVDEDDCVDSNNDSECNGRRWRW